jgi:hypothetical protein
VGSPNTTHRYDANECLCEGDCCSDNSTGLPGLEPAGNTVGDVYTLSNGTAPVGEWFTVYVVAVVALSVLSACRLVVADVCCVRLSQGEGACGRIHSH